jgi:hypothetical protein
MWVAAWIKHIVPSKCTLWRGGSMKPYVIQIHYVHVTPGEIFIEIWPSPVGKIITMATTSRAKDESLSQNSKCHVFFYRNMDKILWLEHVNEIRFAFASFIIHFLTSNSSVCTKCTCTQVVYNDVVISDHSNNQCHFFK